jgi:Tic22-like family
VQTGLPGSSVAAADGSSSTKYPAMSTEEIEDWLEHIPVFAVTNAEGAGVVLKPDNDTGVFYFFMNPVQANATLQQLKTSSPDNTELKVSAFSLGKIWFNILSDDSNSAAKEKSTPAITTTGEADDVSATPSDKSTTTSTKEIQYRLVPDTRDLFGARMLLTMTPEDGEKLKENGSMTQEMAQAAIKKAMNESPKFKTMYNEIPVFTIAQMRMQKQPDENDSEPVTLLPMYFSLQNMIGTWQQFMSQAPAEVKGVEPAINLMSLHDLVDLMKKESEIDWRNVVLVPPTTTTTNTLSSNGASSGMRSGAADSMAMMGGATLGDD